MYWVVVFASLLFLGALAEQHGEANFRKNAFETWSEKSNDCRDAHSACGDWATNGECQSNPTFMQQHCALACRLCEAPEVDPAAYLGQVLVLNSTLGQIRIRPLFEQAPLTCALALELAGQGRCRGCNFYRIEAVPQEGSGPPYGLLQGSLTGLLKAPAREGPDVLMRRGHVALIPNTKEFFINAMDHGTWGSSMTVWGQVDEQGMTVVSRLLGLPYHEVKHPTYGTVMRMLDNVVEFTPLADKEGGQGQEHEQGGQG